MSPEPAREVITADAIGWLRERPVLEGCSVVTSLPDVSELSGMTLARWRDWFVDAAALVISRVPDDGVAIFYQSDIRKDAVWIDKGFLVSKAAERSEVRT